MSEQLPVESLAYEAALEELEQIVRYMESGQMTLDKTLAFFERGEQLARHCAQLLDQAELKVHQLSGDGEAGPVNEE
jgi:exodeoxyribonuclease VII small subunit